MDTSNLTLEPLSYILSGQEVRIPPPPDAPLGTFPAELEPVDDDEYDTLMRLYNEKLEHIPRRK